MMTSSNGNIFRVTGPLCGVFTGDGEVPAQRPVMRSFGVFFHLRLNKRLSKQPWGWWFETPPWPLWRQCDDDRIAVMTVHLYKHDVQYRFYLATNATVETRTCMNSDKIERLSGVWYSTLFTNCVTNVAMISTGALHYTVGCIKSVVNLMSVIVKKGFLRCRYHWIVSDTLIYHHIIYFV